VITQRFPLLFSLLSLSLSTSPTSHRSVRTSAVSPTTSFFSTRPSHVWHGDWLTGTLGHCVWVATGWSRRSRRSVGGDSAGPQPPLRQLQDGQKAVCPTFSSPMPSFEAITYPSTRSALQCCVHGVMPHTLNVFPQLRWYTFWLACAVRTTLTVTFTHSHASSAVARRNDLLADNSAINTIRKNTLVRHGFAVGSLSVLALAGFSPPRFLATTSAATFS
jgi:hypothetical protein